MKKRLRGFEVRVQLDIDFRWWELDWRRGALHLGWLHVRWQPVWDWGDIPC